MDAHQYDEIVSNITNKIKEIDETLLWHENLEQCFFRTCEYLDICGRNGITMNPKKFIFGANTIEFAGFEIASDSGSAMQETLSSNFRFPYPKEHY